MFDVTIIGAGVIGASVASYLSKYQLSVVVLERENDVACGTSKANTGLVHAGYDTHAGTVKAAMNVRGNQMYEAESERLKFPFRKIGSLVVALNDEEYEVVESLFENGKILGIEGLEILDGNAVKAMEPSITAEPVGALYAPSAGITEPWEVTMAYMEHAMDNGVALKLNYTVSQIQKTSDGFLINDEIETKLIVNCAGVHADDLYGMVTETPEFKIIPRRGQYYLLDKETEGFVNHTIFPTPTKMGKGIVVAPTIDGNILVGPDSEDLPQSMKEATETTRENLMALKENAAHMCGNIPFHLNITNFSGMRAEPDTGDFIIEMSKVDGFVNVAGIKSPGLSSAPAIAERVEGIVKQAFVSLMPNEDYVDTRRERIKFNHLDEAAQAALMRKDPRYGRIICRCEMITEGEIVDAIHRNCGGRTLNGIKRRVRPGAGRCQGGFCGPRVMEILSRELDLPLTAIVQEGKDAYILTKETKVEEEA
ncbi:NAD(P)/FAD-dependent oxidoreductase [Fusibacter paucivorans]|uniref:NAD(P)/FAD-dependent oxidoreductase n=1 Tax=Fusibacter paucivorans TaxID=76009 RepID=A0ABS5PLL8_9FIRM|nr:NAD(P)/FAD-dependent oxidoreductase [Fusibacter paucivorans]MBS7526033.1 NAD(P)/FAD-dependent oxidoreductase [Fusibacter paucivorans]